tara:strand:+ start:370 stop:1068 length:699 start_codon:yes stop_codon:yes gene_type:complete
LKIFLSYLIHLFTVSGVLFGFLALLATIQKDLPLTFFFLALALFVDGIDGSLARKVDVKKHTPHISGENLDNIIDYLNYVFVPAFVIYWLDIVPPGTELLSALIILVVSCYTFANNNMKTSDFYFSGFPALWNLVILYFYILNTNPLLNFIVICALSVLTFIPIKYSHPFRVIYLRKTTLSILTIWFFTTVLIFYFDDFEDSISKIVFFLWVLTNIYFFLLTIVRTIRGPNQ